MCVAELGTPTRVIISLAEPHTGSVSVATRVLCPCVTTTDTFYNNNEKQQQVEKSTARATKEHELCLRISEDVQRKKALCETELIKAEPAIIRAMDALNTINKKDLGGWVGACVSS